MQGNGLTWVNFRREFHTQVGQFGALVNKQGLHSLLESRRICAAHPVKNQVQSCSLTISLRVRGGIADVRQMLDQKLQFMRVGNLLTLQKAAE